ncbi:alpha/beta fold hydrolase [Cupriavidus basilensis]
MRPLRPGGRRALIPPGSQPQTLNEYTYLNTEPNSLETTLPFITHAGNRLFYTLEGPASAPVLIFSNSLGTDHTMWAPQAEALGQQFRILRYDTRGHGQSELPPGPSSVAELGSDVIALMDALQIRKAAFCGLSMGGLTGMWLGVNAPQRFSRIVLANTAPKIGTPEAWNTRIEGVLRDGMAPLVEGSAATLVHAVLRQCRRQPAG